MSISYDANIAPDPTAWLNSEDGERLEAIEQYHDAMDEPCSDAPNAVVHYGIHNIVENQAATGDQLPVRDKLAALVEEGISRHEAVHAVGRLVAHHLIYTVMKEGADSSVDPMANYLKELERLTVASWYAEALEEEHPDFAEFKDAESREKPIPVPSTNFKRRKKRSR